MGTVIERLDVTGGRWRTRHSALRLTVSAARQCLQRAGRNADDVDLLVNAGIYRDRNLGEPALAALIQEDIGANPENPHAGAHGTFSFDIANGTCGVLTALQVVDGFLRSHTIDCALVVTGDADPGHGMSEHFPFSPAGAALLCGWSSNGDGLSQFHWANCPDEGETFRATVGLGDARNVLRFDGSPPPNSGSPPSPPRRHAVALPSRRSNSTTSTRSSQRQPFAGTARPCRPTRPSARTDHRRG